MAGAESAPTLVNYIARQGFTVKPAPADYEAQLKRAELGDPVLVIPAGFRGRAEVGRPAAPAAGERQRQQARRVGAGRLQRLVAGFNPERATLALALRGVSVELLESARVDERDLAARRRAARRSPACCPSC